VIDSYCPQCQKNDQCKLVVVEISLGEIKSSFAGPSDLARILKHPPEPTKKNGLGWWWIVTIPLWYFACIGPFQGLCGLVGLIALLSIGVPAENKLAILQENLFSLMGLILGGGLAIISIGLLILVRIYDKRLHVRHEKDYLIEKTAWDRAVNYWKSLYFCERDGIVFDPMNKKYCRPEQLVAFIYTNSS
jgi:hypothetical protein